jgi:hypothetical protein
MKPKINSTNFGSITVKGITYENDILMRRSGQIEKRKKKLSKEVYGTSHKITHNEFNNGKCISSYDPIF